MSLFPRYKSKIFCMQFKKCFILFSMLSLPIVLLCVNPLFHIYYLCCLAETIRLAAAAVSAMFEEKSKAPFSLAQSDKCRFSMLYIESSVKIVKCAYVFIYIISSES